MAMPIDMQDTSHPPMALGDTFLLNGTSLRPFCQHVRHGGHLSTGSVFHHYFARFVSMSGMADISRRAVFAITTSLKVP